MEPVAEDMETKRGAVEERYVTLERLGEGAYGEVWRANDLKLKREVAIKFIRASGVETDAIAHARALARVPHPNIVTVFDVTEVLDPTTGSQMSAIVMELIVGQSLDQRLRRAITTEEARRIGLALIDAIAAYHGNNLAHMDLHGKNVVVGDTIVKVIDASCAASGFFRSTATREGQQRIDLRSVRDHLIELFRQGAASMDAALRFERETANPTVALLRQEFIATLDSPRLTSLAQPAATSQRRLSAFATEAIDAARPDQTTRVREYMQWLGDELARLDPHAREGDRVTNLLQAIEASTELVLEFGQVARRIAAMNSADAGQALVRGFEHLLRRYRFPPISGQFDVRDFDFFKFVGHELVVIFAAHLIRENRARLFGDVRSEKIVQPNGDGGRMELVSLGALSDRVRLLERDDRLSYQADVLKSRHEGPLAEDVSWNEFMNADLLLALATEPTREVWIPCSYVYLREPPRCLIEATARAGAQALRIMLGVESIAGVRARVLKHLQLLEGMSHSMTRLGARRLFDFDVSTIPG